MQELSNTKEGESLLFTLMVSMEKEENKIKQQKKIHYEVKVSYTSWCFDSRVSPFCFGANFPGLSEFTKE